LINILITLSIIPFIWYLLILNKLKPNTVGEKSYIEYLFYTKYTFTWIIHNLKFLFLFFAVYYFNGRIDILLLVFAVMDLLNFKMLKVSSNLNYNQFIDNKVTSMINSMIFGGERSEIHKILKEDFNKNKNIFLLYLNELIFTFLMINFILNVIR
jgi:hypothetical protein